MKLGRFSVGVALVSAASLALSLLFTRIFSVTMYYHFAFFLVSLALLGIAVSGVAVYLLPRIFTPERLPWLSGLFAALTGPLAALAVAVAVKNPLSVDLRGENAERLAQLYFFTSLPFLCSGFAITLAIAAAREHIGRVYAFDLIGAALGCVLIIPLIAAVGGPGAILVAAAVATGGGALLASASENPTGGRAPPARWISAACLVLAAVLAYTGLVPARQGTILRIAQGSKFLNESAVELERWNAFSRVTVSSGEADHKWLHIDADAATRMFSADVVRGQGPGPRRFSEGRVAGLVYGLRREGPALIIGPGGGPDVLSALQAGVPRVVGVEVNPLIARTVMQEHYASWNGDLYRDPRVEIHVDDGRSFVRRSGERYSSIQLTLVDTWAAAASGAFTLSENNLYTVEAFEDYLGHLQDNGVLSMTRWYGRPPVEFLRSLSLARAALQRRGVAESEHPRHFYVAADDRMATLLLKTRPFESQELAALDAAAAASGLRVLYGPERPSEGLLRGYLGMPAERFHAQMPFDLSPTTDNRPFFFYTVRGKDFARLLGSLGHMERNNLGLAILQLVLLISVALTVALVVVPLLVFRRDALVVERAGKLRVLAYFLCLGLGYILVELGLMQRFILFLGHPIYALAVVLATLLASSGVGSALSPRLERRLGVTGAVRRVVAVLAAVALVYLVGLGPVFSALLGAPLGLRIAVAAVLVAGLGLLMGLLLPLGVRAASSYGEEVVPWAWGLNGAASVIGSTLAVVLSMHFGFTATLLAGVGAYAAGALVLSARKGEVAAAPAHPAKAA